MRVAEAQDSYLARFDAFAASRAAKEPAWATDVRKAALARFQLLGFPTTRDEEWRFTPISSLVETAYRPSEPAVATASQLSPFILPHIPAARVVFVNGRYSHELSSLRSLPQGVVVGHLAGVLENDPTLVESSFARVAPFDKHAFAALNTAFTEDGAVVSIPANVVLAEPVHVLYYSTSSFPMMTHPRTIIVAGESSQGTVIESYAGRDGELYFTNAVAEILCGENSHLNHYRVQRESLAASHISMTQIRLRRSAVFAQQNFVLGGALVRNDIGARLEDEGIECTLNGLYLGHADRLIDNHTTIDHAKPHCASHEVYKGMLDGRARGVFNGKIFVRQDAQKTDAKQTNQVLLLSDDATINTKPQLEIFADDVKCTHGATIGQLDAESLFYLRARGIGEDEARAMLVHAFASDIIDRVHLESLRQSLESVLLGYLPK
jgi:Fe-S cluster assembly protein SufD